MKSTQVSLFVHRALWALVLAAGSSAFGAAITFYAAGPLPGGDYASEFRDAAWTPSGILAVGSAAVFPNVEGDTSVMWTPATGWQLLANPYPSNTSPTFVCGRVIAAGGTVIGGSTRTTPVGSGRSPCLWTNNGTSVTPLGSLIGATNTPNVGVNCLSGDASVAYGFTLGPGGAGVLSFRYTASGGLSFIGTLQPGDTAVYPTAHAVSSDGRVVLGTSSSSYSFNGQHAYRYTYTGTGPTGGTMTALPALPQGTFTFPLGLTPDARTAVGVSDSPGFPYGQLVRWDKQGHVTALGSPDTTLLFTGYGGVTADGAVVAAGLYDPVTGAGGATFIHNRRGWFNLAAILGAAGVDLTGWTQLTALGMSADGRLVCGTGQHNGKPEAWVVSFPRGYLRRYGGDDQEEESSDDGPGD